MISTSMASLDRIRHLQIQVAQAQTNISIASTLTDAAAVQVWTTRRDALETLRLGVTSSPTTSPSSLPPLPEHLFVCLHGIYGKPSDSDHIADALKHTFGAVALVLQSSINTHKTHSGVRQMGTALATEVLDVLLRHRVDDTKTYRLSIVGHSLGGIIGRYALVYMQDALRGLHVTPTSFVTLCTPHLGSRRPGGHLGHQLWKATVHGVMSITLIYGQTGTDLLLQDDVDMPLLAVMSQPDSIFMTALAAFQHRTAIAMIQGDHIVPYASAAIHPRVVETAPFERANSFGWRWTMSHSGFGDAFRRFLDVTYPCDSHEPSVDATDTIVPCVDERHEVDISPSILAGLCSVPWRRLNLFVTYGGLCQFYWLSFHTWPLGIQLPSTSRSREFIQHVLVPMLVQDHAFDQS
ncbi:Aste57867_3772 [Aphanomyces stellatus]|uniref:Aste57867_3772 protein n=1 Tax=Aphanomyces stellatus TaxID=120398 RepID=A0A485KFS3_9STRA|nr:hypothetical protein As57867_003761 [Aphanomyces stellatus]VFT80923.1 Aste57867_3772 [Aphanomyces stellatus]